VLPLRPLARTVETTGLRRPVRLVLLLALALTAGAAVLAPALAAAALGCAVVALALVAGLALATRWTERPAVPGPAVAPAAEALPASPAADALPADALGEQLRALHDEYAELTNQALTEGREDLVPDLADEYADRALRLITAGDASRTA
jgi:hypothetical protein